MQRIMNEETKFELGTNGDIESIIVNGNKGALFSNSLMWVKGNVNYNLIAKGFSNNEIMKIAESIK